MIRSQIRKLLGRTTPSQCRSTFEYQELDEAKHEIRLLEIETTTNSEDAVELSGISTHSLDDAPNYVALSYACGDQTQRECIRVQRTDLSITKNLYSALWHMRLRVPQRSKIYCWADAVCIQQDNNAEKSHQILFMDRIFGAAAHVIVWLGPSSDGSDRAIDLLNTWANQDIRTFDLSRFLLSNPDAFDEEAWSAVNHLLSRDWWGRMWTYQEAILAQSLTFLCGQKSFQLGCLSSAVRLWNRLRDLPAQNVLSGVQLSTMLIPWEHVQNIWIHWLARRQTARYDQFRQGRQLFSLHNLQRLLHSRGATQDHDKLYAMLGVAEDIGFDIKPDYEKPVTMVYTEFTAKYITFHSSLSVLSLSGIGNVSDGPLLEPSLPSWVPDLRASSQWPITSPSSGEEDLHNQLRAIIDVDLQDQSLRAVGVECDIAFIALSPSNPIGDNWEVYVLQNLCRGRYPTGIPNIQALFRTLILDHSDSRSLTVFTNAEIEQGFWNNVSGFLWFLALTVNEHPSVQSCLGDMLAEVQDLRTEHNRSTHSTPVPQDANDEMEFDPLIDDLLHTIFMGESCNKRLDYPQDFFDLTPARRQMLGYRFIHTRGKSAKNRNFFLTEEGYMGLGPRGMQANDKLCFLFGGTEPCILRSIGEDFFAYVGSCYVYGLMQGEIIDHIMEGKYRTKTFTIR